MAVRRVVVAIGVIAIVIAVFARLRRDDDAGVVPSSAPEPARDAFQPRPDDPSHAGAIPPRPVDRANAGLDDSPAPTVVPLVFSPPPDVPPTQPGPTPEVLAQLRRGAEARRESHHAACVEFARIVPMATSDDEMLVGLVNIATTCASSDRAHDQRLATEAQRRSVELQGSDATGGDDDAARSYLLFVDAHDPGTEVTVDDAPACDEPCLAAVPIDGQAHRIGFSSPGRRAHIDWTPRSIDDPEPALPAMR